MKRVLVTGGAAGIGKHIAIAYLEKGYEVFVLDINESKSLPAAIHTFKVDLCNQKQIHECFEQINDEYGKIDILINNGAVSQFHKSICEIEIEEFDKVINTNLRGTFLCCKEFIKMNKDAKYGRIINIASTRFHQNEANWEAYGASKGGIISLTNSLCVSLINTNITVNAISPGWIQVEDYDALTKIDHLQHPSRRVGKPQDIVNVCLFLSEKENDFINGANIIVDGGMTKRMIYADSFETIE